MSFSIIYGASFMSLDLICNSEEERDEWVATLQDLMAAPAAKGSDRRLPILQEAWERITGPKRVDSRKGVDIADFLRKAKLTVPRKLVRAFPSAHARSSAPMLGADGPSVKRSLPGWRRSHRSSKSLARCAKRSSALTKSSSFTNAFASARTSSPFLRRWPGPAPRHCRSRSCATFASTPKK